MIRSLRFWPFLLLLSVFPACQQEEEVKAVPLNTRLILITDKFYDVKAISAEKAIVVGYGGKILVTTDGGKTWQAKPSGTDSALYNVKFADAQNGWVCGQDGLILHTSDGGETWHKQESGVNQPIFAMSFVDKNHGWAVSEQATYLRTTSGGESWETGRIEASLEGVSEEATLAMVDPVLYDVQFIDEKTGWMVGEFGKIYHSTDGGMTWNEQQGTLLGHAGIDDALNLPTFFGVRFKNSTEGIAVGIEGKVVETTDGGKTWVFTAEDLAAFSTDPLYALRLFDDGKGWIVGAAGRVLQLRDGDWKNAPLGRPLTTWLRSIDFFNEDNGWIVGGYGTILHTTDGGKSWLPSFG
ncbi:MAG TPA: YCF48-related protein [Candidatus Binatia bacterium]|nr:YCF48-related protein [Candidatus Binatia bacterium]